MEKQELDEAIMSYAILLENADQEIDGNRLARWTEYLREEFEVLRTLIERFFTSTVSSKTSNPLPFDTLY